MLAKSRSSVSIKTDTHNTNSLIKNVFQIEALTTNIFEYLDVVSLLVCRRTNRRWFYDSYSQYIE